MALLNPINKANQTTTSSRMKKTFIVLCILLCIISMLLYSNVTFRSMFSHQSIIQSILPFSQGSNQSKADYVLRTSHGSNNVTISRLTTSTGKANVSLPPYKNRRFAIFACSIHANVLAYTFYTPLTAVSWQRVGYQAIVVFVGDFNKPNVITPRLNLSRNYLKHVGAHIVDLQCNESYSIKISQLVRVFSGFLPDSIVKDEDNILTGDSDLIPLKASEYQPKPGTDGYIFNAFCCGQFQRRKKGYTMFPMGHIFLQKKAWRAIIMESDQRAELLQNASNNTIYLLSERAPLSFETITLYGRHEFKDVYDQRMDKGDNAWYMDQIFCSMLLTDYRSKHQNFSVDHRGRADRLDRAYGMNFWNRDDFNQFGDAHLKHDEILEQGNWMIFNKLLKTLFNETTVQLFNDYHKQYMIIDKVVSNQVQP